MIFMLNRSRNQRIEFWHIFAANCFLCLLAEIVTYGLCFLFCVVSLGASLDLCILKTGWMKECAIVFGKLRRNAGTFQKAKSWLIIADLTHNNKSHTNNILSHDSTVYSSDYHYLTTIVQERYHEFSFNFQLDLCILVSSKCSIQLSKDHKSLKCTIFLL